MSIHKAVQTTRERLRWCRAVESGRRTMVVASGLGILTLLALHFTTNREAGLWVGLGVVLTVAAVVGFELWRGAPSMLRSAIALDQRLGLDERTSTATFLAAAGDAVVSREMASAVMAQATVALQTVDSATLQKKFPLPKGKLDWGMAGALALAIIFVPLLPTLGESPSVEAARDVARERREAQQIREAARRLEKRASEIANASALKKHEGIRALARAVAQDARALSERQSDRRHALARLAQLSERVVEAERQTLGRTGGAQPIGSRSPIDALSELAAAFDRLDMVGLATDLERFKDSMMQEAQTAASRDAEAHVDHQRLAELLGQLSAAQELLDRLEKLLNENPALRERLERALARQREALQKLKELLERLEGA